MLLNWTVRVFSNYAKFLVLTSMAISEATRPAASLCPIAEYIDDLDKTVTEFFECPGVEGEFIKNEKVYKVLAIARWLTHLL